MVFLAHLFQSLFQRTRVPDILPLMLLGYAIGPLLGLVHPVSTGSVERVFVTVALVVILFEGGLELRLAALTTSAAGALRLTLSAFVAVVALTFVVSHWVVGQPAGSALLAGLALGGTSPAVVLPLLPQVRLSERTATTLSIECGFSDVLAIVATLAIVDAMTIGALRTGALVGSLISSFLVAFLIGGASALGWSLVLGRIQQMQRTNFVTQALVLVVFGVSEWLGLSGAVAALAFGVALGNLDSVPKRVRRRLMPVTLSQSERDFLAETAFLLKAFFFVYLGAVISFRDAQTTLLAAVLSLLFLVSRYYPARLGLARDAPRREITAVMALGPKGVAAGIVASVPIQAGIVGGAWVRDIVFAAIPLSVVLSAMVIFGIEKPGVARALVRLRRVLGVERERAGAGRTPPGRR